MEIRINIDDYYSTASTICLDRKHYGRKKIDKYGIKRPWLESVIMDSIRGMLDSIENECENRGDEVDYEWLLDSTPTTQEDG